MNDRDNVAHETHGLDAEIAAALVAKGKRRSMQEKDGCVCAAAPPVFNPRLASQQGLFLLNCAEDLTFRESLTRMMRGDKVWCRTFDVQADAIPDIEERLFQLNIQNSAQVWAFPVPLVITSLLACPLLHPPPKADRPRVAPRGRP